MNRRPPLLLMFLGSPGSGKSYMARALADRLQAVRLNGDSLRVIMYGSLEAVEKERSQVGRDVFNKRLFNGLDYCAEQVLLRGYDVVYDASHNKKADRSRLEAMAASHSALAVLVWVKTPYEVALKRGQMREEQDDQRRFSEAKMREVMARIEAATEAPTEDERVIIIDGQATTEQQLESFDTQLAAILETKKPSMAMEGLSW